MDAKRTHGRALRRLQLVSARQLWLWLLCLSANVAQAQSDSGFTLQLSAPDHSGCIDAARLTTEVAARTGRPSHPPQASASVHIHVQIDSTKQGYRANLSIQHAQRELLVEGSCELLDEMLVVVIASSLGITANSSPKREKSVAWELDPPRRAAAPEPAQTPAVALDARTPQPWQLERAAAAPNPAQASEVTLDARTPQPWQLELAAAARMFTGIMPRPAFGPALRLLARSGALGLHVGGSWLPSDSYSLPSSLMLRATGILGELGVCAHAARESRVSALFCADLSAGAIRASLEPLLHATARWDALIMLVPHAQARLRLGASFGFALALGAAIPVIFPRYLFGGRDGEPVAAHTPELGLFAELAFWLKILP